MNQQKLLKIIFKLIGAKFYLDWLLPTNWSSKNPIYKYFYRKRIKQNIINTQIRLRFAYSLGSIHFIFLVIDIFSNKFDFVDVFVNVYPVIVNLYIGYRCWMVKTNKSLNKIKIYDNNY